MRVAGLSMTPVSILRHQFTRIGGTHIRCLQSSSARMQDSEKSKPQEITAGWLRRLLEDNAKPPKLYAWTPENLAAGGGTSSESVHRGKGIGSRDKDDERRRIYILGVGNIGRLYAMCLSKIVNAPPITLVVHRKELLEHWAANPGIELTRYDKVHKSDAFDIEWWTEAAPDGGRDVDVAEVAAGRSIGNLIIATKASDAVPQVDRIRRYLGSSSTVAFAQNGMCKLWPPLGDAYVRARFPEGASPNWIACVTTHGVTSQGPFRSTHASPANALVGPVMSGSAGCGSEEQMGYLIRQIADAPDLDAKQVSRKELWVAQLEKLVVNATINPLTAVLRCKNGELLENRDDSLPTVIDKLLSEASEALNALVLDSKSDEILLSEAIGQGATSEVEKVESLKTGRDQLLERFSFPRLRKMVLDVGEKVRENTSSMLQDVLAGKPTEIDDFNGWLVDSAMLLNKGPRLPTHEKLIALVNSQTPLTRAELCAKVL
ncbi:ketoisovalerate reductase [Nemania sp. FL0031]|nr:ketoisovalerate reductase [Nemania sp. FL0031]